LTMRCHWLVTGFALFLFAPSVSAEGYTFPVKTNGPVQGTLTVSVAEPDASMPVRVKYELEIRWEKVFPDIKEPEIVDLAKAWKWQISPDASKGNGASITYAILLEQIKQGKQPLPDVILRFRTREQGASKLEWTDILKETRPPPWPEAPADPKPPLQPAPVLSWVVGIFAIVLVLLGISLKWLRPKRPSPPLTPAEQALRELDRIEGLGLAGPDESGWYPEEISSVIRRFLSERYGRPAQQQTTAEFFHSIGQTPDLSADLQKTLKELLERCDLAKFAALRTPPDECRRIAALARALVQQTSCVASEAEA